LFKQQKFIFSELKLEIQDHAAITAGYGFWGGLSNLEVAAFLLCPHITEGE
jgi:hypothetical protein